MREILDLRLVSFALLADAFGLSAGAREDVFGVSLSLVAGPLLIRAGALDVVEGIDDRERRLDALELHLGDLDAGVLVVEQFLQQGPRLVGDLLALVRHRRLDRRAADDVAERALGRNSDRQRRVVDPEQEFARVADLPEHGAVRLDDVLVSGEHLAGAAGRACARCGRKAGAELDLVDLRHLGEQHRLDRIGQVDMQAGIGRLDPSAETQNDALFVRLDAIERRRQPGDDDEADQRRDPAPAEARHAENVAEAGLDHGPDVEARRGGVVLARFLVQARVNLVQRPDSPRASSARAPAVFRFRSSAGRRRRGCHGRAACGPGSRSRR